MPISVGVIVADNYCSMKELTQLSDEEKISLYKKVKLKYWWATSPKNIARLAKVELKK